jgi:zinc transport system substrate-binding protein
MRWAAAVVASAIVLVGCGGSSSSSHADGSVEVVASFYPVAYAARRVGGPSVRVRDLTPSGVEPHDLEITTREADRMEDAHLVLHGAGRSQPAVAAVAKRGVADPGGVRPASVRTSDDPHFWLDPIAYRQSVDLVATALTARGVDGVAARRDAFDAQLTALDRDMRTTLSGCDRTTIVTSHAAFDHLARRYGLQEEPITGLSPESEPDAGRMASIADLVTRTGTTTIFTEELVSPRVADALAREAGVETAVLNPLEGLSASERRAGDDYVSVMRRNLATLASALGCQQS